MVIAASRHSLSCTVRAQREPGPENVFGGAAFAVESEHELERAVKVLPPEARATPVHEVKDAPGGGKRVTFYDPVDGFPFHLVYGQTEVEMKDPKFPELKVNFVSDAPRMA